MPISPRRCCAPSAIADEDGADQLHVPVTLQDRRLYVGPAPIAPLPQLKWR